MPKLYGDIIKGKEFMSFEFTDKDLVIDNANGARSACVYAYKSLKPTFFQEWILMFVFLWGLMTYVRILNTKNNK